MRSTIAVLDDALDRVSALDFAVPNPFVNHGPMACEALDALGFDALIDEWVRRYEASMGKAVQPVTPQWHGDFEWNDLLGNHRLLPEWMGYFDRSIADDGWPLVIEVWVPRLMPGLVAALFHGVIRTAHAVRAIEHADTPARTAELARALGNWAVWFGPGQPVIEAEMVDEAQHAAAEAAADGARCYATAPTIFNLHGITGAMAVQILASHLPPADGAVAVAQLRAEHENLYRDVTRMADDQNIRGWEDSVAVAASESHYPHQIKLVEACYRGFEITGDAGFVVAAKRVTSTGQNEGSHARSHDVTT